MRIGNHKFDIEHHTYIMGILNVTPDSFSDGGRYVTVEQAKARAAQMIEEGADIIDVGGESTRPGHTKITDAQEIERVIPIILTLKQQFDIPVSIDTYKSAVAKEAIDAGADLINDIWGLQYDEKMAKLIANAGLPCCLMHNRQDAQYQHFKSDVFADLKKTLQIAEAAGIAKQQIVLDPGIGFAKDYQQNLEILRSLAEFHQFGCPLLLAASRKSVIGNTLNLPVTERLEGTLATTALAVVNRFAFVRVHDIKENKRVIQMTEAMRSV